MSSYFSYLEQRRYAFPTTYIIAQQLKYLEGSFIIDPSLPINLIRETELALSVNIDRSEIYILRGATLVTIGKVKIDVGNTPVEFQVISHDTDSEITGVLGSVYFTGSNFESNSI